MFLFAFCLPVEGDLVLSREGGVVWSPLFGLGWPDLDRLYGRELEGGLAFSGGLDRSVYGCCRQGIDFWSLREDVCPENWSVLENKS